MCLGRGPVASNAAGCSSPQAVREKMIEKGIFISNPNGTWILKKNCREQHYFLLLEKSRADDIVNKLM